MPTARKQQPSWDTMFKTLKGRVGYDPTGNRPFRILLWGPQATGKTSAPLWLWQQKDVEKIELTDDDTPDALLGLMLLKDGSTYFQDGPAPRAYRKGVPLIVNEIDMASPSVKALIYGLLDDAGINSLVLPTGEHITPSQGYTVIATTNERPDVLPPALLSRFEVIMHVTHPADGAFGNIPNAEAAVCKAFYRKLVERGGSEFAIDFDLRRLKAYRRVLPIVDGNVRTALTLALGDYEQACEVESMFVSQAV
jgi:midasin (ATPase involved in ribosome maturation)